MGLLDWLGRRDGGRRPPTDPLERSPDELTVDARPAPGAAARSGGRGAAAASEQTLGEDDSGLHARRVVASLIAIEGELAGHVYPLRAGDNLVGRATECDVVLESAWISRHHARIVCDAAPFRLLPLTDKTTRLNGERCETGAELRDGDTIQLGRTALRVRTVD